MSHDWRLGGSFPSSYFYSGLWERYNIDSLDTYYCSSGIYKSIFERAIQLNRISRSPHWHIGWIYK